MALRKNVSWSDSLRDVYCYRKVDVGVENAYLPLNRRYKPLGVRSDVFIDYDAYARDNGFVTLDIDADKLNVWTNKWSFQFWLYSDNPDHVKDYRKRLAQLEAHIVSAGAE